MDTIPGVSRTRQGSVRSKRRWSRSGGVGGAAAQSTAAYLPNAGGGRCEKVVEDVRRWWKV